MSGAGNPPAGWYPDPTQSGSERWWDGVAWGQQTRMPPAAAPLVAPPAAPSAPAPVPAPVPAPNGPALGPVTANSSLPIPGATSNPKTKSGCLGLSSVAMLAIIGGLGLLALLAGGVFLGLLAGNDNDTVDATKTTAPGSETTSPPGNGDATSETTTAPDTGSEGQSDGESGGEIDDGSGGGTSGLTGDGSDDVVSCTRIDEDTIILQMVNNGDETSSYWLTVGFFDEAGTRLADESSFVNFLRPGERSIEEHFVFEEAGTVCEVLDVDRFPGVSSAEELADAGECVIAAEPDSFDDFAASLSVTNSTATTSDYSVEVAFVDPDGIRRGTGSVYIEAVRAAETAPGDVFSSTDFVEGYSCEIVGVTRTDS